MSERICLPLKVVNKEKWADMSVFGKDHLICAETFREKDQNYGFAGGHRVRLLSVKKNVHWKIPVGVQLDIAQVAPAGTPPARRQPHGNPR
jgi:hypothetical protein